MPKPVSVVALAAITALFLTGCDQIPSFDAADKEANTAACESMSATWETLNQALSSGDIVGLPLAVSQVPAQLNAIRAQATDQQLLEALTDLQDQVQYVIDGNQPDLGGLVASGIGISARCAILGAAVDFELPQLP